MFYIYIYIYIYILDNGEVHILTSDNVYVDVQSVILENVDIDGRQTYYDVQL